MSVDVTLQRNMLLAATNKADAGIYTAGSQLSTLPITNLTTRQVTQVWRTGTLTPPNNSGNTRDTSAGTTWFEVDLGIFNVIDYVGFIKHNITRAGQIRVRMSQHANFVDNADGSALYDSGLVTAWPAVGGFGSLPWGDFDWGDAVATIDAPFYSIDYHLVMNTSIVARYVRVDIIDTSNPNLYVQGGRFYVSPGYFPSVNIQYGYKLQWNDNSKDQKSIGGQTYTNVQSRFRSMSVSLTDITELEIFQNIYDFLQRRKGISGDLVIIPRPDRPELFVHEAVYGKLTQLDPLVFNYFGLIDTALEIEELI